MRKAKITIVTRLKALTIEPVLLALTPDLPVSIDWSEMLNPFNRED
jgi:hypothetical protein